jgi:hypothetical protein
LSAAEKREWPLEKYRNIGIMAHIDAGKVGTEMMVHRPAPRVLQLLHGLLFL